MATKQHERTTVGVVRHVDLWQEQQHQRRVYSRVLSREARQALEDAAYKPRRDYGEELAVELGLGPSAGQVLHLVRTHGPFLTTSRVAELRGITKGSAIAHLNRLVRRGLVKRTGRAGNEHTWGGV